LTLVEDFKRYNASEQKEPTSTINRSPVLWQLPPTGKIKINWDAAVNKKLDRIGINIVVQDNNGCIKAARSTTQRIEVEPVVVAEAIVALHAVFLIKEMGFHDLRKCFANCAGDHICEP
jgi:hypothetical protein